MEETKDENNEVKQKTEATQNESPVQEESPARRSLLWIFAGGYLVYKGIIKGTDDASKGFLVAGGIFIVIGAVLLIKAVRNLAKAGAEKASEQEAARKMIEENAKKKMSISERAHLAENLDDAEENETEEASEKGADSSAE